MSDEKRTLTEEELGSVRKVSRRAALGTGAAVAAGLTGAALGLRSSQSEAQGCTDSDGGSNSDPPGGGSRCRPRCTDSDDGSNSDPPNGGTRCGRSCTDSDNGSNADGVGRGRRC